MSNNNSQSGSSRSNSTNGTSGGSGRQLRDLKTLANGRYRVINQVGRGGMSVVYHAYDTANDRDVAIKILSLDLALEDSFLARFRRESELMHDLSHPNILRAYDYGQDGEIIYLVMSYYGGGTLKERINGPLPLRSISDYLSQIAAGLGYAHSRNIVHRDVKPSNVLIHHASDSLVLSDFGIAKALSNSNLQRTGTIMGTPLYMAPEQFLDRVDQRTDIYALGVVLYQMLTGDVPFKGEGIGFKHLNDPVPPLSAFGLDYDPNIEQVMMKALAKRPEARYQKVEEFSEAFRQAVENYGESQTGIVNLEKPTMFTKVDSSIAARWGGQVNQEVLPGQGSFSALPVLEPRPGTQSPATFTPPPPQYSSRPITPPGNYNNGVSQPLGNPVNFGNDPYQPMAEASYNNRTAYNPNPDYVPVSNQRVSQPAGPPFYGEMARTPTGSQRLENNLAANTKKSSRWIVLTLLAVLVISFAVIATGVVLYLGKASSANPTATSVAYNPSTTPTLSPGPTSGPATNPTAQSVTATAAPVTTSSSPNTTIQTTKPTNTEAPTINNPTQPINLPKREFQVLYVSQVNTTTKSIYSFSHQNAERHQLTDPVPGTQDTNPLWIGGGQTIIFQSDRDKGKAGIYKMAADGMAQTLLVANAYSPGVAPYGNDFAYVSSDDNNIYVTNLTNPTSKVQLTNDSKHKKVGPSFSPDNKKIAFAMEDDNHIYQIYIYDKTTGASKQLVQCQLHCVYPTFSPDGTKIAYNTATVNPKDDEDRVPLDIFIVSVDGKTPPQQLTKDSHHNSRAIWIMDNWGKDGTRIYFNSDRGVGEWARIFAMNADGTNQILLVPDRDLNGNEVPTDDYAPSIKLLN